MRQRARGGSGKVAVTKASYLSLARYPENQFGAQVIAGSLPMRSWRPRRDIVRGYGRRVSDGRDGAA